MIRKAKAVWRGTGRNGGALALLRLEADEAATSETPLVAGAARVTPEKPSWAKF